MSPSPVFLRCFPILIVVAISESFGQSTVKEISEECYRVPDYEGGNSEIAGQIQSLNMLVGKLSDSFQAMQNNAYLTRDRQSVAECNSNRSEYMILEQIRSQNRILANLSDSFQTMQNNASLARDRQSRAESNSNRSEYMILEQIRSQNRILANLSESFQTMQAQMKILSKEFESKSIQTTVFNDSSCPKPEKAATVVFPPQCCSFPFTFQGQLHHRCIPRAGGNSVQCLIQREIWVTCGEPRDYVARNHSINTTIPFFGQFMAIHVHNWIVFQQRIGGSVSFNLPWEEYKNGFGKHDGNFWMGLEKVYKMTNNASYKLRMEFMTRNGSWYSVEYDTFRVESEVSNYKIHVTGYSGDLYDVMNYGTIEGGEFHNGMNFSTYDRDNDRDRDVNCASYCVGGWWYNACRRINLNGPYGSDFRVVGLGYCSVSRMMMKKV